MKKKLVLLLSSAPLVMQSVTAKAEPTDTTDWNSIKICKDNGPIHNILGTIAKSTGLDLDIDLFNAELVNGLRLRGRYNKMVDRVAETDIFVRKDVYTGSIQINSQAISDEILDSPDSFSGVKSRREIPLSLEFNRFSKDACGIEAAARIPMKDLPLDTKRALKMKKSEYFKLEGRSQTSLSLELFTLLGGSNIFGADFQAGAQWNLSYQIHVVRLDGNKVKLRLLGLRIPELFTQTKIGAFNPIEFTNIDYVNNRLTRNLNLSLFQSRQSVTPKLLANKADIIELTIDLSNEKVRTSYDNLLGSFVDFAKMDKLQKLKLLSPVTAFGQFRDLSSSVSKELRELAQTNPGAVQTRVDYDTKGKSTSSELKLSYVVGRQLSRKSVSSTELKDVQTGKEYQVTNFRQLKDSNLLFNLSRARKDVNLDVVYNANLANKDLDLDQIVLTVEAIDKRLGQNELLKFLDQMARNVRPEFFAEAQGEILQKWFGGNGERIESKGLLAKLGIDKESYKNSNLYYQVVVGTDLLRHAQRFASVNDAKKYVISFLEELRQRGLGLDITKPVNAYKGNTSYVTYKAESSSDEVNDMATKLYKILDVKNTDRERDEILQSLSDNPIFIKAGMGIITGLVKNLSDDQLKKFIGYQVVLRSRHLSEPIRYSWNGGLIAPDEAAKRMTEIRAYSDRDGKDLELEAAKLMD